MQPKLRKLLLILVGFLLVTTAVYLILRARVKPVPEHPYFAQFPQGNLLNIAHQGGEQVWPSNTFLAHQNAVELGVDILEMDTHQTADGVFVLIHDDTVDRTTDGHGRVDQMTFAEIQTLDAGYYWTNDDGQTYPFRGQGIQIPAITDIFDAFPEMMLNVEIKPNSAEVAVAFCQLIQEYNLTEKVLVASFHDNSMTAFRQACPEVATSMTQSEIQPFWILNVLGLGALYQAPAEAFQVPETAVLPVLGEVTVLTERFVRNAHKHNIMVHVWTINEADDMARLAELGLDGIITDRPDLLQTAVETTP